MASDPQVIEKNCYAAGPIDDSVTRVNFISDAWSCAFRASRADTQDSSNKQTGGSSARFFRIPQDDVLGNGR